jgi:hypothetical protein
MRVEHIHQFNDTPGDFDNLFRLWQRFNAGDTEVCFDLTWCRIFRQNAGAFLGGLARVGSATTGLQLEAGGKMPDSLVGT